MVPKPLNWRDRLIRNDIDIGALTLIVAVVLILAMIASFGAIHHFALQSGGLTQNHAWMAPVFTDVLFIVAAFASLSTAIRQPNLPRTDLLYWGPLVIRIASALGCYYLNIMAAPQTPEARVVAALPPTGIVICTEFLMVIVRRFLGLEPISQPQAQETEEIKEQPVTQDGKPDLSDLAGSCVAPLSSSSAEPFSVSAVSGSVRAPSARRGSSRSGGQARRSLAAVPDADAPCPPSRRAWTDADVARLRELGGQGLTQAEIGRRLGRSPDAVRNQLARIDGRRRAG